MAAGEGDHALRVAVVGGSIAGSAAAVELTRRGHDVTVFERRGGALESEGVGVFTPATVLQQMIDRRLVPDELPVHRTRAIRYVARDGSTGAVRTLGEAVVGTAALNWSHVYRELRARVPDASFHAGSRAELVDLDAVGAVLEVGGVEERFDLVVAPDGYRSEIRTAVSPDVPPRYLGAIFWRGLLDTRELDGLRRGIDAWRGLITRVVYPGGHGTISLIPHPTVAGAEQLFWGFYLQVPEAGLSELLVDADGRRHAGYVGLGQVRPAVDEALRARLLPRLPDAVRDLVDAASVTSLQSVWISSAMPYAHGHACLVGDAGVLTPPFTGSGVLKAIADAGALADALRDGTTVAEGLLGYDRGRQEAVAGLVALGDRGASSLVFDVPDTSAMTPEGVRAWLGSVHPGVTIEVPQGPA